MANKWWVNILDYPLPEISHETSSRQQELLNLWSEYHSARPDDGTADFEDFFEQAYRLEGALHSFGKENIFLTTNYVTQKAVELSSGKIVDISSILDIPRYGFQEKNASLYAPDNVSVVSERTADDYMHSASFREHANRKMVLTGNDARGQDIYQDVLNMARDGVTDLFIKTRRQKYGIWRVKVDPSLDHDGVHELLLDNLDWSLVVLESIFDAFLVQEFTQMNYEYRLFVVDGEVVTGAGCIEEYTPLNNQGSAFDSAVRKNRINDRTDIEFKPDVVDTLVKFGRHVAREMNNENKALRAFTLDVALDESGNPLVVERNGILNAGLYASQPALVTDALSKLDF